MAQQNNKLDQSLIEFVTQQQKLNDFEVKIPQESVKDFDPIEYGNNLIEIEYTKHIESFLKAYNLGNKLGKELSKNAKKI
jgi:hypothetical protein